MKTTQRLLADTNIFHLIVLVILHLIIVLFLAIGFDVNRIFYSSSVVGFVAYVVSFVLLGLGWLSMASKLLPSYSPRLSLKYALITLSPVVLLLVVIPYNYFLAFDRNLMAFTSLGATLFCIAYFFNVIKGKQAQPAPGDFPKGIALGIFIAAYIAIFSLISIAQFNNYENFNAQDLALYNQLQWNNLRGNFFETSTSGSNFTTHNSPFLILLTPFYALCPHPKTLLVLQSIFLGLSIIPLLLIIKDILDERKALLLGAGYMFYPFLVAQNFSAPHEVCFLPPLLLFSYYYFEKKDFKKFLIFLILSVSVKEHIVLVAVAYGFYAFLCKRSKRWILIPLVIGLLWGMFSLWLMQHFQQVYHTDPHPSWFIENYKDRFAGRGPAHFIDGLKTANIGNASNMLFVYQLFSPVLVFFPVFSAVSLLALPELMINLLSDRLIFFPIWHYHTTVSVFFLISTALVIKKLSGHALVKSLSLKRAQAQKLLCFLVFFCIMAHAFLWIDLAHIHKRSDYAKAVDQVVALVPKQASVSVPKNIAGHFSSRKDYFLLEDKRMGDYVILDSPEHVTAMEKSGRLKGFDKIFHQQGINVYREK